MDWRWERPDFINNCHFIKSMRRHLSMGKATRCLVKKIWLDKQARKEISLVETHCSSILQLVVGWQALCSSSSHTAARQVGSRRTRRIVYGQCAPSISVYVCVRAPRPWCRPWSIRDAKLDSPIINVPAAQKFITSSSPSESRDFLWQRNRARALTFFSLVLYSLPRVAPLLNRE